MDKQEIYRMIVGGQFDLLTDEETQRLAERLTGRTDVDPVDVSRRLRAALTGSEEAGRDQAFNDALAAAAASPGMRPQVPRRRGAGALRGVWRYALAAAAGAVVVWLAVGPPRGGDDAVPGAGIGVADAVFLGVERAATEPTIDLDSTSASHITLIVEARVPARVPASPLRWRVTDNNGADLLTGEIAFAATPGALRHLAVTIPKSRLAVAGVCWLLFEDAGGNVIGRWSFRVE